MRVLLLLLALVLPVRAEEVIVDLAQNQVAITATFAGSEIFVFGAVSRVAPVPEDAPPLQVLVSIVGPEGPVEVRRKERVAGIWVNRTAVRIENAPYYHAIATTAPLEEVVSAPERLAHRIGIEHLVRLGGGLLDRSAFREAVMRVRREGGLYLERYGTVDLREGTLFDVSVPLPANLVEGDYRARVFLARGGQVLDSFEQTIPVRRSGLEAWLYTLAMQQPLAYGLLSVELAMALGWGGAAIFRYLKG